MPKPSVPIVQKPTPSINIFDTESSDAEGSQALSHKRNHSGSVPSSIVNKHLFGVKLKSDQSGSSEDTGFDTDDTPDELLSPRHNNRMTTSSLSFDENLNDLKIEVILICYYDY